MIRLALIALALAGCATSTPKPAPPGPPSLILDGSADSFRRLAADSAQPLAKREHAVSELVAIETPAAIDALRALATDAKVTPEIRAAATLGLAQRQGADAVALLSNLLADGNAKVRLAAARGLGMVGGDAARSALQGRLDAETDPQVREELQRSLARTTN